MGGAQEALLFPGTESVARSHGCQANKLQCVNMFGTHKHAFPATRNCCGGRDAYQNDFSIFFHNVFSEMYLN